MGSVPLPGLIVGVLLGALAMAGAAAAEPPATLRAVTFNLLHGGPASGLTGDDQHLDQRLGMVARELRELRPDVVGLQESSIGRGRGNVAERLAQDLGLHWAHASATRRVSGIGLLDALLVWAMNFEEGPAVLSRWPIVDREIIDLPRCRKFYDPRVVLRAVLDTPAGPLQVFSTHLGHDGCQARRLGEIVRARAGALPALVMGDFNAAESTGWMQELVTEHGFVDVFRAANPDGGGATVWQRPWAPDPTVTRRVDFIFLLPGRAASTRVAGSRTVLSTPARLADGRTLWPSDHYGVLADLAIETREARR